MGRYSRYFREEGDNAGKNISWSSIFAGVVTFIAVFITLSLIGSAIGFGLLSPKSSDPLQGVGTGVMIWTVITFILSFMCAGFIAGVTAQRVGVVHGFLTWATTIIALVLLMSFTTASLLSGAGHILGSVAGVAGEGIKGVAGVTGNVASGAADKIAEQLTGVDTKDLQATIQKTLKDTDKKELQPNYIQGQLDQAKEEVKNAAKEIVTKPDTADQVIKNLTDSLKKRAETIGKAADKEAIAAAVAKNTELTEQQAKEATDNIYNGIQKASTEAQKKLDDAAVAVENAKAELSQKVEQAKDVADDASNAVAKTSIWTFIAMILSMVLTSIFGLIGANYVKNPVNRRKM